MKRKITAIIIFGVLCMQLLAEQKIGLTITEGKEWNHKIPIIGFLIYITATPQIAVWIEDTNGNMLENIYVTGKIAEFLKNGKRREALPVWGTKFLKKESNKIDGVGGATQSKGVIYAASLKSNIPETIRVFAEINNSFDYNDYYTKDGKNRTEVSGDNGQPSLVYMCEVKRDFKESVKLELYGAGSVTGKDGEISKDLSKITTAKEIVDSIEIDIR